MNELASIAHPSEHNEKFKHRQVTRDGKPRASVELKNAQTLWFNTGTLCNIECANCYIESSPTNDALVYLSTKDVVSFLDQLEARGWPTTEIGFTGGEPFMNPDACQMIESALARQYDVLVLTNAMKPMMRPRVQAELVQLRQAYGRKLTLRVSLDHYSSEKHDEERGRGTFDISIKGMRWLRDNGIRMTVAGRTMWGEDEAESRAGFAQLFEQEGFEIDASDPGALVLFPEMDESVDVPEITTECWGILGKSPSEVMCSSSRMVVRRKGAHSPSVIACTLLPYTAEFEMGTSLQEAEKPVFLNHPHCAKFCVLGGASCSA